MPTWDNTALSASSLVTASQYNTLRSGMMSIPVPVALASFTSIVLPSAQIPVWGAPPSASGSLLATRPVVRNQWHQYHLFTDPESVNASAILANRFYGNTNLLRSASASPAGFDGNATAYTSLASDADLWSFNLGMNAGTPLTATALADDGAYYQWNMGSVLVGLPVISYSFRTVITALWASSRIKVSVDGATWTALTGSGDTTVNYNHFAWAAPSAISAQYIRVTVWNQILNSANLRFGTVNFYTATATAPVIPTRAGWIETISAFPSGDAIVISQTAAPVITASYALSFTMWRGG